jgi:glycosyltransferase involved in cell wall biosynthesis
MRVLVIHFEYTKAFFGAEKLTYLYCQGLKALGHDVHLISLIYPFRKCIDRGEQFKVETIPTSIPYFKNLSLLNVFNNLLAKHSVSKLFKKNETIIFTDAVYAPPFLQDNYYAVRTVVPLYGAGAHSWVRGFAKTIGRKRLNLILHKAKALTVISKAFMTRLLDEYKVPNTKVFLVHEAVDTDRYNRQKKSERLRNKLLDHQGIAIMVTPHSRHNKLLLLKIMKTLKQTTKKPYKFILTGKMRSDELKNLIDYAKKQDFYNNLMVTGYIPESVLPKVYASSDIFLNVGFNRGMTVLEAMASGLPIVSLDPIVSTDWIIHGTNGFIVKKKTKETEIPDDCEDEVIEYLRILIEDSTLRKKMSSRSQEIAKTKFDYRIISKKLEEVFFRVLELDTNS